MAIREIRVQGDPILEKTCRPVALVTPRIRLLAEDMLETMYAADGVGLAAPQVGVLRRLCVIDIREEGQAPLILVNPEITWQEGEQTGQEGCLSVPGKAGDVTRPMKVRVSAFDLDMNPLEIEGEGLLARAICHEVDHLDGRMYTSLVEGSLYDVHDAKEEDEA